jgi:hypothetical protein
LLVHKKNYSYVITINNLLYPFVTDPLYTGSACYVDTMNYYKLKLIVDEETTIFDNVQIKVFDEKLVKSQKGTRDHFEKITSLTQNTSIILTSGNRVNIKRGSFYNLNNNVDVSNLKYLFNIFYKKILPDNTFVLNKYPNRLVENITELCECGMHYRYFTMNKKICIKYRTGEGDEQDEQDEINKRVKLS